MGSLLAGALDGLGGLVGLAGDSAPYVPSAPVEIGTSGPHHGVAEAGAWQALIVMFGVVIFVGAGVLMYAVRQRAGWLERRRVRRMAVAVALMGDAGIAVPAVASAPPRTAPATPGRRAPNA